MTLPREELLAGSHHPQGLSQLVDLAEEVLRTWQPCWSHFLAAPLQEEVLDRLGNLSELKWERHGGHPAAERCRLLCYRAVTPSSGAYPIHGLLIEGNFLFDRLSPADLRQALQTMGVADGELGDVWVRGDRGGQGLCTPSAAAAIHNQIGHIRDVEIRCESAAIEQLQLPVQRAPRRFSSVEASCRLDAIASAGFGLSRAKIVNQIKAGRLRLNWTSIHQASRDLVCGDRLQLQDRGSLEVLSLAPTKRGRWRVELLRT